MIFSTVRQRRRWFADLLVGITVELEKKAWMIRAYR
jgi:DNA-binding ferritin-like protein